MSIFDDNIDIYNGIKDEIKKFIEDNYKCSKDFVISVKSNENGLYEVSSDGNVKVKNKNITSLTNGLFEWSEVGGFFSCSECNNIKLLEGSPKKVCGDFYCFYCKNLKSLKGAPEYVYKMFFCKHCGVKFIEDDVRKVSKVKGNIYWK